jgi:4'-phosphopantetheinyl transferase
MPAEATAGDVRCRVWSSRPGPAGVAELTGLERRRWSTLERGADRDRFLTGVRLQRRVLRALTGADLPLRRRCVVCGSGEHGPAGPPPPYDRAWSLSLSHSGQRVVVAVTPASAPVGVDVEELRPVPDGVRHEVLSPRERTRSAPSTVDVLVRWVRKEATLKATRRGLTVSMADLEVAGAGEPPALRSWAAGSRPDGPTLPRVALADVDVGPGYLASVAILTPGTVRVEHRRLDLDAGSAG